MYQTLPSKNLTWQQNLLQDLVSYAPSVMKNIEIPKKYSNSVVDTALKEICLPSDSYTIIQEIYTEPCSLKYLSYKYFATTRTNQIQKLFEKTKVSLIKWFENYYIYFAFKEKLPIIIKPDCLEVKRLFSNSVAHALMKTQIYTLADILSISATELANSDSIGPKRYITIKNYLQELGYTLDYKNNWVIGNSEKTQETKEKKTLKILYCYRLNEQEGKIEVYELTDYSFVQNHTKIMYIGNEIGLRHTSLCMLRLSNLDKFIGGKLLTFDLPYEQVIEIIQNVLLNKVQTLEKDYNSAKDLYEKVKKNT